MRHTININGSTFRVKNIKVLKEAIWSDDTGRGSDGKILGDIVAYKYKLEVEFPPLNDAEAKAYNDCMSRSFYPVTFYNPYLGRDDTRTMYNGELALSPYSSLDVFQKIRYQGVTVHLIEQ